MQETVEFVAKIKKEIENIHIERKGKKGEIVTPNVNFVLGTYYKGTGLEEVTKKLEEYIDKADRAESEINCI